MDGRYRWGERRLVENPSLVRFAVVALLSRLIYCQTLKRALNGSVLDLGAAVTRSSAVADFAMLYQRKLLAIYRKHLKEATTATDRTEKFRRAARAVLCMKGMAHLAVIARDTPRIVKGLLQSWPDIFRWMSFVYEMLFCHSARSETGWLLSHFFVCVVDFFESVAKDVALRSCLAETIFVESTLGFMADIWRRDYSQLRPSDSCLAEESASRILTCGLSDYDDCDVLCPRRLEALFGSQSAHSVIQHFLSRIERTMEHRPINDSSLLSHLRALDRAASGGCSGIHEALASCRLVSAISETARELVSLLVDHAGNGYILCANLCLSILATAIGLGSAQCMQVALRHELLETIVIFGQLRFGSGINTDSLAAPNVLLSLQKHLSVCSSMAVMERALESPRVSLLYQGRRSLYPRLKGQWDAFEGLVLTRLVLKYVRVCGNVSCFTPR